MKNFEELKEAARELKEDIADKLDKDDLATVQSQYNDETKKLEVINSEIDKIDEKGRKLLDEYEAREAETDKLSVNLRGLQGKVQSVSAKRIIIHIPHVTVKNNLGRCGRFSIAVRAGKT